MPKLLDRWLMKELFALFLLFLTGFYCLFSLLDYSTHVQEFLKVFDLPFYKIALYYLSLLVKQFHILFPLAFLIAGTKILTSLNIHHELIALRSAGLSLGRILRPFFLFALGLSFLTLINFEFALPKAEKYCENFQVHYLKPQKKRSKIRAKLKTYLLEDESKLIAYTSGSRFVDDVFWILSCDEFWHFKRVDMFEGFGYLGDQMKRDKSGQLCKVSSQAQVTLPQVANSVGSSSAECAPLTELYQRIKRDRETPEVVQRLETQFYYKLGMLLVPTLLLTALAPPCLSYRRHHRLFLLYACSLLGFIAFFTLMDSLVIAGEGGLIAPWIAMAALPIALQFLFLWRLNHAK